MIAICQATSCGALHGISSPELQAQLPTVSSICRVVFQKTNLEWNLDLQRSAALHLCCPSTPSGEQNFIKKCRLGVGSSAAEYGKFRSPTPGPGILNSRNVNIIKLARLGGAPLYVCMYVVYLIGIDEFAPGNLYIPP